MEQKLQLNVQDEINQIDDANFIQYLRVKKLQNDADMAKTSQEIINIKKCLLKQQKEAKVDIPVIIYEQPWSKGQKIVGKMLQDLYLTVPEQGLNDEKYKAILKVHKYIILDLEQNYKDNTNDDKRPDIFIILEEPEFNLGHTDSDKISSQL